MNKIQNKFNEIVYSIIKWSGVKQELALRAFNKYSPIVDDIINAQSYECKYIERTLASMLEYCYDDKIISLYKKLCQYYYFINAITASMYMNAFHERWDNEDEQNAINDFKKK